MKVAILFGGTGSERMVSVASAQQVASQLPAAELLFWSQGGIYAISAGVLAAHRDPFVRELQVEGAPMFASIDELCARLPRDTVLLLALHGREGEDGQLQATLDRYGIAYTGSGAEASRLAYDKPSAKRIVAERGVAIARGIEPASGDLASVRAFVQEAFANGRSVFAKPCADGSSVGLFRLTRDEDLARLEQRLREEPAQRYLLEEGVVGRELTVGVVEWHDGLAALPCSEVIVPSTHTFGYEEKYVSAAAQEITPADVSAEIAEAVQALSLEAHRALGCRGYSRTDCIWDGQRAVFLEINTLPGLTVRSFVTQQLACAGRSMTEFLARQLEIARVRQLDARS